jgi:ribosomal protein S18 acetylase RimI-like enzyme
MKYNLQKSSASDIAILKDFKLHSIFDYAENLPANEIDKITDYVEINVPKEILNYQNILVNNKIIGCLLVTHHDDGVLIDEIYLKEEYRGKGIGTNIIKNILKDNNVYLWVYKKNINAKKLYDKLGFKTIETTETRFYMKHNRN